MEESASDLLTRLKKPRFGPLFGDRGESNAEALARWFENQRMRAATVQEELNQLIYEYFGLNEQEVALVEEAYDIFDRSDTPPSLEAAKSILTLQPVDAPGLKPYADVLTATLNSWASGTLCVSASGGVDSEVGLGLIKLDQTKSANGFKTRTVSSELSTALQRLEEASTEQHGSLAYVRRAWAFDGTRIYILKPALMGQWTRTAALNDAADLYAHIAEARRRSK